MILGLHHLATSSHFRFSKNKRRVRLPYIRTEVVLTAMTPVLITERKESEAQVFQESKCDIVMQFFSSWNDCTMMDNCQDERGGHRVSSIEYSVYKSSDSSSYQCHPLITRYLFCKRYRLIIIKRYALDSRQVPP